MTKYLVFILQTDGTYKNSNGLWVGTPPIAGLNVPTGAIIVQYPGTGISTSYTYVNGQLIPPTP